MSSPEGNFGLLPNNIEEVHAFWIAGGSCDGCSIAAVGATSPSVEDEVPLMQKYFSMLTLTAFLSCSTYETNDQVTSRKK